MARKASINFKPVTNIKFAVSHSERTELSEPGYLLPKEHQLPNIVVSGSLSEADLTALFMTRKESMSRQAKRAGASPFWEGVVVLKNTDGQEQSNYLKDWKVAYEKATGHKVLHMSIHLDEGFLDSQGNPQYNPHAHIIVDRMNEKNIFIHLGRKQLSEVQDLTAKILEMDRGSTLDERKGRRGRKHIPHGIYRDLANGHRLEVEIENNRKNDYANWLDYKNNEYDLEKEKNKEANKLIAKKDAEIAQLKAEYTAERAALKASGEAKQADYQALKVKHEAALADLAKAQQEAAKVPVLVDQVKAIEAQATTARQGRDEAMGKVAQQATEIERLKAEYAAERAQLKASSTATQQDYQQLKASHEAALAELTANKAQAAKVPSLVEQVKAIEAQATTARQGRDEAMGKVAQQATEIERLKAEYAAERAQLKASSTATQQDYQQLKASHEAALAELTASKAQAAKVPELVDQLKAARQEAINTKLTADERYKNLRCQALEIQAERNELAKKVATLSVAPRTQTPAPVHQVQAQPERPAPRPTPAPTVQAPTQAVLQPDTAQAYVWPKLTEEQFQALPTRQLGDRVIAAAREVLVMCVQVADAAAKQKLFPAQVVRALENLLENYREPAKPVPEQQQPLAAAPARTQTPTPSRGGLGR